MQRVANWPDFVIRCNGCQLWTVIEPREDADTQAAINTLAARWNRRTPVPDPISPYCFVAWFTDQHADPTDQDQEWIWLILIHADSEAEALRWGDQLAAEYCRGEPWNVLTCSYIDQDPEGDLSSLSETRVGDRAFKIAWADKLATVILPALERARDDVLVASRPRPRTAGAPGAPEPPAAREMPRARFEAAAEIRTSDRPLVIELAISCAGREEHLDFRPYELDVAVYVYTGNDTLTAQKLPVESITDEVVVPLVASFVERSLALLI
jgi:hypothetical protein